MDTDITWWEETKYESLYSRPGKELSNPTHGNKRIQHGWKIVEISHEGCVQSLNRCSILQDTPLFWGKSGKDAPTLLLGRMEILLYHQQKSQVWVQTQQHETLYSVLYNLISNSFEAKQFSPPPTLTGSLPHSETNGNTTKLNIEKWVRIFSLKDTGGDFFIIISLIFLP